MSSALVGCLVGAFSTGYLSDRWGRKRMLLVAAALFIVSAFGTGAADRFQSFILWRILGGVAIGVASNLSPVYIAEIAPARMRGRLVSLNQLTIVLGILLAQIVNWQLSDPVAPGTTVEEIRLSWNGQMGWRWMFWSCCIPATLFFLFAFFIPESPRWLAVKGQSRKAVDVMSRIVGREEAAQQVAELSAEYTVSQTASQGGLRRLLHRRCAVC